MATLAVTPYHFGAPEANEPVEIDSAGINFIFQTIRDDDIFDDEYRGIVLTRIVRSGLEIITDEPVSDVVARWESDGALTLVRFSRKPTDKPGDDPLVCVNSARVTDVRPVPAGVYDDGNKTIIMFGGVQVLVTQDTDTVRGALA